uniref:Reduced folate carrier n=1 Tax=Parascaris univalens TaxID=6257 RepID=A0A915BQ93_PARUN
LIDCYAATTLLASFTMADSVRLEVNEAEANVTFINDDHRREKRKNVFRDPVMHWKATTVLICLYGIIKEFRPATPFLTPYLVSSFKNFTDIQLYSQIYPFWTYSYLIALIPIFFLTDILRYKAIIMLEASCLCATWAFLIWGVTIWQMQLMQVVFGIASAAEIAYYSYMYAVVDQKHYKKITSYIRAAALVGKFFAFGLAQFLISTGYGSYLLLNQISFGAVSAILIIAVILPPIPSKIIANKVRTENGNSEAHSYRDEKQYQENRNSSSEERVALEARPPTIDNGIVAYFYAIWSHFKIFKHNKVVLKWSLWWALTSCGIFQVYNYVQTLWATMQKGDEDTKNGLTECANTLIAALISFFVQYMRINWIKRGELILFLTSSIAAILIFSLSQTTNIIVAYVLYVAVASIYQMLMTAASANIAAQLD